MKNIKKLILLIITVFMFIPGVAFAANANFAISAPSQGIVGNQLTVTVTISSSSSLGGWEMALSYDKSLLQLSSAPEGANGTHVAGNANASGVKSKTYTYKFKVLKSGTATVSTTSTDAYGWDESTMSVQNSSKKITLKTQAEIEASYSSDAYLKSLTVGEYTLNPTFKKETTEYTVEVENDVEKVTISAAKNDANASVSGTGEKELKEGNNKFEIVVTAQKGNSLTYTVNVERKELNPIPIVINGRNYTIIRKSEELPDYKAFLPQNISYNEEEIPALINEGIKYTLIAVKDENGNVYTYIFNNGEVKDEYYEITTGDLTILPKSVDEEIKDLVRREINIEGHTIVGYSFKSNSKQVIIRGVNAYNGDKLYYLYDIDNKVFIPFNIDDISELNQQNDTFKLIIIILGVVVALLIILVIIKKPSKKRKNKEKDEIDEDEEINEDNETKEEVEKVEEIEVKEEKAEPVKLDEPKLSRRARKKIAQEERKRLEALEEEEKIKQKRLEEEIAKEEAILEERKRKKKKTDVDFEQIENPMVEDLMDDDPLNQDDDFMEFWETMEIKTNKKD